MRDYNVKSNIEIKFESSMKTKGTDVFDAEAKVKEIIRYAIKKQLKKILFYRL